MSQNACFSPFLQLCEWLRAGSVATGVLKIWIEIVSVCGSELLPYGIDTHGIQYVRVPRQVSPEPE